jgi:hypothetical protein
MAYCLINHLNTLKTLHFYVFIIKRAGIAQSVKRLAMGWMTEGSKFEFRWGEEFSLLNRVQIVSGAHPVSYPMGTGGSLPDIEAAGA